MEALPSGSAVGVLLASDIVRGVIDEPTYDLNQAHAELDRRRSAIMPRICSSGIAVNILKERADLRRKFTS